MKTKNLVVFGYGARGQIYATFAKMYPDKFNLVAVIENNPERIQKANEMHENVPVFNDYKTFLEKKIQADIVAVATQDEQHKEHAIAMMQAGYDLLLEKPVANNKEDCMAIYEASKEYNKKVIVCHVLRYSAFYSSLKKIIESGKIGEVVSIHTSENVGYFHQAHSYVRGPWKNSATSSPMILAKCCHDMDIIRCLIGEECISVNSYGDLMFFKEKNAPQGCAQYCSDCKVDNCIYKAQDIYLSNGRMFVGYFNNGEITDENILRNLKHSPYDMCVFKAGNDVVDHQVVIMRFANGKTACHTMTAFSKDIYRDIKIYGTKAEIVGKMEDNCFEIRYFGGETEKVVVDISAATVGGHNGSDYFMMNDLFDILNNEKAENVSYLDVSIESHLMSFAAEESRLNDGRTVNIIK